LEGLMHYWEKAMRELSMTGGAGQLIGLNNG
jgi:hypothetical protein